DHGEAVVAADVDRVRLALADADAARHAQHREALVDLAVAVVVDAVAAELGRRRVAGHGVALERQEVAGADQLAAALASADADAARLRPLLEALVDLAVAVVVDAVAAQLHLAGRAGRGVADQRLAIAGADEGAAALARALADGARGVQREE